MVSPIPKPHTRFTSNSATFCFYLGDCVDILDRLTPGSIDAIVTSPPYNLGIRYRSYKDTLPRSQVPRVDRGMGQPRCARDGSRWVAVPERRRETD